VVDDDFRLTSLDAEKEVTPQEHVLCRFVPVNPDTKDSDVITINTPFYVQLQPNQKLSKSMSREYWLNLAGAASQWTAFLDEEDVFSIKKGTLTEQKAVYQSREYNKNIDRGISFLYESWDKYPKPAEAKAAPANDKETNRPKQWINDFVSDKSTVDNFSALTQFIKFFQNFVIMAGNSATADPEGMLNDSRNYERESNTGFCLRFRQELAVRANVLGRVFSIIAHPLFTELVKFPSGRTTSDEDEGEEKKEVVAGLTKSKGMTAEEEKKAELEEERRKNRELALDCFRECTRLGALIMVDYAEAAIEVHKNPSNIDFLVKMVYASAFHQLGVAVWLSLIFENGRDRKSSMTLTSDNLKECMRTWDAILRKRAQLQRSRQKALSRRYSPNVWRAISARDEELARASETFIRFLCAICHSVGIPDPAGQKRILDALVQNARRYRLGADGQPIFDGVAGDSDSMSGSGASLASVASSIQPDNQTRNSDDEKTLSAKIPKPIETAPTILRLIAATMLGAARTTGHGIFQITKELVATTGLHELDLTFFGLLKKVKDASLSPNLRGKYCDLLHRLYIERMYPRRLVNYTPLAPGNGKEQKLVNPSQMLANMTRDRVRRSSAVVELSAAQIFKAGRAEVSQLWGFILEYLSACGPHYEMNNCTIAVLAMTRSLIELDFEDIDEDAKDDELGLFGVGPNTKLSDLATQLFTILKSKQHNTQGLGAVQWVVEQLKFRDVKLEICRLYQS